MLGVRDLIGYACASTDERNLDPQLDALKRPGVSARSATLVRDPKPARVCLFSQRAADGNVKIGTRAQQTREGARVRGTRG